MRAFLSFRIYAEIHYFKSIPLFSLRIILKKSNIYIIFFVIWTREKYLPFLTKRFLQKKYYQGIRFEYRYHTFDKWRNHLPSVSFNSFRSTVNQLGKHLRHIFFLLHEDKCCISSSYINNETDRSRAEIAFLSDLENKSPL